MAYEKRPKWSPEEDGRATEWRAAGLTWSQVAARLGRSESAVRNRFQSRGALPKQIEKIPADVIADRDARAQARFDAHRIETVEFKAADAEYQAVLAAYEEVARRA
jgi:hypothetical protein